jgi:luciferase family oxidoreductase group 1
MPKPLSLSVLDLVPVVEGSSVARAVANTIDLAQRTEAAGYHRYWLAEHHLNPGVAGSAPGIVIAAVAGATTRIRVGSGVLLMGHQTPLSVVEQFGMLDALYPGRIDLGLGRSAGRRPPGTSASAVSSNGSTASRRDGRLVIPPPFDPTALRSSPQYVAVTTLLQQPNAQTPSYDDQVEQVLSLLNGRHCVEVTVRQADGTRHPAVADVVAVPGSGADVEVWIAGSSGGESAELAGRLGLPFAANYHISPAGVLEAVDAYRLSFRPSQFLDQPFVMVSADVVAADTEAEARDHASGYAMWVHSIRSGKSGAIPFPTPETARQRVWTESERAMVADRVATQFVGTPDHVVEQLGVLADETGADELLLTTITHDHRARRRSYELIAEAWIGEATTSADQAVVSRSIRSA